MDTDNSERTQSPHDRYMNELREELRRAEQHRPASSDDHHHIKEPVEDTDLPNNRFGRIARKLGFDGSYYDQRAKNDGLLFSPNKWLYWVFIFFIGGMFLFNYYNRGVPDIGAISDAPRTSMAVEGTTTDPQGSVSLKVTDLVRKASDYRDIARIEEAIVLFPEILDGIPSAMPLVRKGSVLTSPYGRRHHPIHKVDRTHFGIDLAAPFDTPVYVTASGRVESVTISDQGHGNHIVVEHPYGFKTLYGHLSKILVKEGDMVSAHELIGLVGSTGVSTGPHIHYEVEKNGSRINPIASFNLKYKILTNLNP